MENYIKTLNDMPLFKGIPAENIPDILKCFSISTKSYHKGEYIKNEGEKADFIGILTDGYVYILQNDYLGNRNIVSVVEKGEMFGEAFACADIDYLPVDIFAASSCTIIFLSKDRFLTGCDSNCSFHKQMIQNLMKIISKRNVILNNRMKYISCRTTREKLLTYLSDQSKLHNSKEFSIPFNRQELANFLCVERSAMSAQLSALVSDYLIETHKNSFKLFFD